MTYDSAEDTRQHIAQVALYMGVLGGELYKRACEHDASKLEEPEKSAFDEVTPLLRGLTYGSEEYRDCTKMLGDALAHHYKHNRHHPEHFPEDLIRGMNLVDLVEMLCDWKASTLRHADGDIRRSIEINQERFGYSDELKQIFLNTLEVLEGSHSPGRGEEFAKASLGGDTAGGS